MVQMSPQGSRKQVLIGQAKSRVGARCDACTHMCTCPSAANIGRATAGSAGPVLLPLNQNLPQSRFSGYMNGSRPHANMHTWKSIYPPEILYKNPACGPDMTIHMP